MTPVRKAGRGAWKLHKGVLTCGHRPCSQDRDRPGRQGEVPDQRHKRKRAVWRGWGLGLQRVERRLARPIPKAGELRLYSAGSKWTSQGLFRTGPPSFETSGGRGCPGPWSAKVTEGCVRLRLRKACSPLHSCDQIGGEVWAGTPTCHHGESASVTSGGLPSPEGRYPVP